MEEVAAPVRRQMAVMVAWARTRPAKDFRGASNGLFGADIFPNDVSITRLVGATMLEQNDEWRLNRRYMQLEGLQTLGDTVPTRLSAVAR